MAPSDVEKSSIEEKEVLGNIAISHAKGPQDVSNARVQQSRNAAFTAAVTASNLSPWTKDSLFLFWAMFVSFLCSCANGYDGSLMTTINEMPHYRATVNSGRLGTTTGIIFSIYTIGGIVGPWFAGPITDRWGRRVGMFTGALGICCATAIISSSHGKSQFVAGRFFLGFFVSVLTTSAPSYCIEICPPQWRGRMTGFYNCGWFGGSIPAAGITLGTSDIDSDLSWRLPLIFQAVPSAIVIFAVFFLPESPRWLMANGREEEARAFLVRFHGSGNNDDPVVALEWVEFKENIALDGSDKRFWDYSELFMTKAARWRSLMVILMGVFGQFSGNGLGYFNTEIYRMVGYSDHDIFVLNLGSQFVSAFGAGIGVSLADRMPRRKILVVGTFLSGCMLAGNAGLSSAWANAPDDNKNLSIGRGSVFFYFMFQFVYSFTYTPLQALYPVECLHTNSRAKGMAMYAVVVGAISFINTFAGPIALDNIKNNYIYIFVGWDMVESVLWYLLGVETVGRTLEELEEIFSSPNPVAASKQKHTVALHAGGATVLVDN